MFRYILWARDSSLRIPPNKCDEFIFFSHNLFYFLCLQLATLPIYFGLCPREFCWHVFFISTRGLSKKIWSFPLGFLNSISCIDFYFIFNSISLTLLTSSSSRWATTLGHKKESFYLKLKTQLKDLFFYFMYFTTWGI